MKKICIVGSLNTDIIITTQKYPNRGENISGEKGMVLSGGKGGNAATAVAKLGKEPVLISSVGADYFGDNLLADLRNNRIDITSVKRTPLAGTGLTTIIIDAIAERTMVNAPGANALLSAADIDRTAERIKECGVLLAQLEVAEEAVVQAMKYAKEYGLLVIVDPAPVEGITMRAIRYADILIPNEQETKYLTGIDVNGVDDAVEACRYFETIGIHNSIIKMGHRGALVYASGHWEFIDAIPVEAVDTVVGDTFSGALACSLSEGKNLFQAARFASVVSALKVTRLGPQIGIPTIEEVEKFIDERNLQRFLMT
ncbi:Ribokinase [Paenibacillus sp. CECT 9249]|uniref:ribokinase n=1 Tax=Paenibacillus sp. CECT 9249 TaxID=2845385 RepID=UPI001E605662|nr:ribokinase [Paenibacillus sp. CECT 9249]CAH0120235.1 Ribokinase [Paenibacillus sp. CECT 9249]